MLNIGHILHTFLALLCLIQFKSDFKIIFKDGFFYSLIEKTAAISHIRLSHTALYSYIEEVTVMITPNIFTQLY